MTIAMALLISIFGIQGSGNADGVGGSGHGNVFDAYTPPEYWVP